MASAPKQKESPTEPFKRALGLAVRAIAGDGEAGAGQLCAGQAGDRRQAGAAARAVACPFRPRGCRDPRLGGQLGPDGRLPRRESARAAGAVRRSGASRIRGGGKAARIEALGANRMPGMAANLTARVEDQYGHGRYAEITERADAPLEDALALIVRERLTGAAPPETARAMVDLWRPWIEERAGRTLARMDKLAENQETFGRQLRDLLKTLDLSEERSEGEREEGEDDDQDPESGDQNAEDQSEGEDRPGFQRGSARRGRGRRDQRERAGCRQRSVRGRRRQRRDGRRARAVAAQLQRPR